MTFDPVEEIDESEGLDVLSDDFPPQLTLRNDFRVDLIDSMGGDNRVVQAARVSLADDSRTSGGKRLIRYLLRNGHWSPFEHVMFTFRTEIPIFLARQVMRHKSQIFNEMSLRYSEALPNIFIPDKYHVQSGTMKQGRGDPLDTLSGELREGTISAYMAAWVQYHRLLGNNVAREQAREVLPVAVYTILYTTMSLRSLLHFASDRMDSTSQTEARIYAAQIKDAVRDIVPDTLAIWEELNEQSN